MLALARCLFGSKTELAGDEVEPILAPEQLAVNHIGGCAKHAGGNRLAGVGLVLLLHRLAVRLLQPLGRQAAFLQQDSQ